MVGVGGLGVAAPAARGEDGHGSQAWGHTVGHGQSRSHRGCSRPSRQLAQPAPPPRRPRGWIMTALRFMWPRTPQRCSGMAAGRWIIAKAGPAVPRRSQSP